MQASEYNQLFVFPLIEFIQKKLRYSPRFIVQGGENLIQLKSFTFPRIIYKIYGTT